ncbi:hypothetical protein PoHVEF18_003106 [Penicillium ochrochloron]
MVFIAKLLALALIATATPILRRDAITVENDVTQKIGPQTTTLNNDVNGFPASGLTGGLAIHTDIEVLSATVNDATNDIKSSGSFSEADGTSILAEVQNLVPTLSGTLAAIGSQAPDWTDIPGGQALVLSDLKGLNTTFIGFTNALIAASPADLVPAAVSVRTQIMGDFNSAIAAYSP